jgi:hypothetical protein
MQHTHRAMLEIEVGDILAMIDILLEQGILDQSRLDTYKQNKKDKLKLWSKIYE